MGQRRRDRGGVGLKDRIALDLLSDGDRSSLKGDCELDRLMINLRKIYE